ncbi:MAG: TIGR03435 family protein [Bryobacteraceae bacterium]
MAVKPKMKPAEPNGRIKCEEGPGADQKDVRDAHPILGRLLNCQNMTMARFADMLQGLAPGYIHAPVLDATGLEGSWDFTLSFSTAGQLQGGGGRAGATPSTDSANAASDPNGALSLPDAVAKQLGLKLEQTKRPVKVLVIDHVEEKPADN